MTPELTALARAYMALPGAPEWDLNADGWDLANCRFRQADNGILWLRLPRGRCSPGEWLPDLTDAATAGAMLDLLPVAVNVVTRTEPRAFRMMWLAEDGEGLGPRQHTTAWVDTLAEAVARVAVAVGRAG